MVARAAPPSRLASGRGRRCRRKVQAGPEPGRLVRLAAPRRRRHDRAFRGNRRLLGGGRSSVRDLSAGKLKAGQLDDRDDETPPREVDFRSPLLNRHGRHGDAAWPGRRYAQPVVDVELHDAGGHAGRIAYRHPDDVLWQLYANQSVDVGSHDAVDDAVLDLFSAVGFADCRRTSGSGQHLGLGCRAHAVHQPRRDRQGAAKS